MGSGHATRSSRNAILQLGNISHPYKYFYALLLPLLCLVSSLGQCCPLLVLNVLALLVRMSLVLALPGKEEACSSTLIQRDQLIDAPIAEGHVNLVLPQLLLEPGTGDFHRK